MIHLFTMMGDKFIESFDEKSIIAHRILAYKGIEYKNNIASLDSMAKDLGKAMGTFPVFKTPKGEVIHDMDAVVTYLSEFEPRLANEGFFSPYFNKLVTEWALDSFIKKVRYFLWLEPNNWGKLKNYLENIYSSELHLETIANIRRVNQVVYKNSLFSRYDSKGKLTAIEKDLEMINYWCDQNIFLTGDTPALCDFALFAVIHLFFHPYIEESKYLIEKFPNISRWCDRVDSVSTNDFTKRHHLKL